jgi:hypothetical protein
MTTQVALGVLEARQVGGPFQIEVGGTAWDAVCELLGKSGLPDLAATQQPDSRKLRESIANDVENASDEHS